MASEMVPVPENRKQEIAKQSGLPVEKIGLGVILLGGEPYFTNTGLEILMDKKYDPGRWGMEIHIPEMEEYKVVRWMSGAPQNGVMSYVKCKLIRIGLADIWEHATVTKKNAPMLGERNPIELATTRAQNRAMRKALGHGFSPFPVWDGDEGKPERVSQHFIPQTGSPQAGFLAAMQKVKELAGEESYYAVLNAHGFEKSNEPSLMNDVDMMEQVLTTLCEENEIEISTIIPGDPKQLSPADAPQGPIEPPEETNGPPDVEPGDPGPVGEAPPGEPEGEKPPLEIETLDINDVLMEGRLTIENIRDKIKNHPGMTGDTRKKFLDGFKKLKSGNAQAEFLERAQKFIQKEKADV